MSLQCSSREERDRSMVQTEQQQINTELLFMDSSFSHNYQQQNDQPSLGLLRFRSAPSSLLSTFNDNGLNIDPILNFKEFEDKSRAGVSDAAAPLMKSQQSNSALPPHYPRQNSSICSSPMGTSRGMVGTMALRQDEEVKRIDSILARQNSSPAGLVASFAVQNDYATMKSTENYCAANSTTYEGSPRLKSKLSFSSTLPSSLSMLSQIPEIGNESIVKGSPDSSKLSGDDSRFYGSPGFPYSSYAEDSSSLKRDPNGSGKLFTTSQNGEHGSHFPLLSHHLSLPKTSAEMVAIEKFLNFQDSVPCKIRAKRGCATHPRSIAERVRRTRISERMRKLQELVPNMDKQTNTADMLDLAVDYIKDLQKQYKILGEKRANCKCSSSQKPVENQTR
ncbi:hypothetical protein K2173_019813 [Erythroxylum novogranatense]|uniref:BHLH domain-containing protein n=1 Tax=Erythroxylum novogranatense TaxID=1862640 RepID=A0AAV8SN65_9ROSI|nr:hypothetical protein K2173_019813 [Erythroxylum novogranatense]